MWKAIRSNTIEFLLGVQAADNIGNYSHCCNYCSLTTEITEHITEHINKEKKIPFE